MPAGARRGTPSLEKALRGWEFWVLASPRVGGTIRYGPVLHPKPEPLASGFGFVLGEEAIRTGQCGWDSRMEPNTISDLQAKLTIAAEALRKAEERALIGQFAIEVMHEIRNPLEALGHLTHLAASEGGLSDTVRGYLEQAREQMALVQQIAGQTLGFARIVPAPKTTDLSALAEAALRVNHRRVDAQGVRLVRDLPKGIEVDVLSSEILQALSNLLANALDALPEKGTISLRLRKRSTGVHILIADNGHGIPAEHVERLFEPFFTTKEDRGTGLGLALTKKIVERHGGKISVRSSVDPGRRGTTFKITLPASTRTPERPTFAAGDLQ